MKTSICILGLCLVLGAAGFAEEGAKLPVLSLKYDGSHGTEMDEDTEEFIPAAMRHSFTFRLVEEFSRDLTLSFPVQYTFKDYFSPTGDYYYVRLSPYISWDIGKEHNLKFTFTTKWMDYADLDTNSLSKDYFQISPLIAYAFKPVPGTKFQVSLKGIYPLYVNPEKTEQDYAMRLSLETRLDQFTVDGYYSGQLRLPLGAGSLVAPDFLNMFGVGVEWDPNRDR
jgi:hypothetical protein